MLLLYPTELQPHEEHYSCRCREVFLAGDRKVGTATPRWLPALAFGAAGFQYWISDSTA